MAEERWQVTVRVPMSLPDEQRDRLFNRIADAVAEWEPEQRDGWDADVAAGPAGEEGMLPAVFGYDLAHREAQVERERLAELAEKRLAAREDWKARCLAAQVELERLGSSRQAWAEARQLREELREEKIWREDIMHEMAGLNPDRPMAKAARRYKRERDEALEEVGRLRREVEFEANADHTWLTHHERVCACVSDEQASRLGPGFARPVCAIHTDGGAR